MRKFILPTITGKETIKTGDMPGDKVEISEDHVQKSYAIAERLAEIFDEGCSNRLVLSIYGGSGVGKSEVASLLGYILEQNGMNTYVLSGDNYPHKIPMENDKQRELAYEQDGYEGLKAYLGTPLEIDFERVNHIITQFKAAEPSISLKRMGRSLDEIWDDVVDFQDIQVLIIEWTHGNNSHLQGVDIPIFLNSTPAETLEHRQKRNRDAGVDSPFVQMVLEIEQKKIANQAESASIIVTKSGEIISYAQYKQLMEESNV